MHKIITVLIVDEDSQFRNIIKEILSNHHYNCIEAADKRKALTILKESEVDIQLVSIRGKEMTGIEYLKKISELSLSISSIIISEPNELLQEYHILEKPFSENELLMALQKYQPKQVSVA